jgi:hypothetical protein
MCSGIVDHGPGGGRYRRDDLAQQRVCCMPDYSIV